MLNRRSLALTLLTPRHLSKKTYKAHVYRSIDQTIPTDQHLFPCYRDYFYPQSPVKKTTSISVQAGNQRQQIHTSMYVCHHNYSGRTPARSTSAAITNKHLSLRPPSPQLPQRTGRSTARQAKDDELDRATKDLLKLPSRRSSRLLFAPLNLNSHVSAAVHI